MKKLHTITHLVVGKDELKPLRTKFLVALCVSPDNIIGYEWIEQSLISNTCLPSDQFRITARSAVEIERIEKQYGFSLQSSINKAVASCKDGGVLSGWGVYIGPRVMGGTGPSKDEVSALLRASGAVSYSSSAELSKMMKKNGDCTKLIVITKSGRNIPISAITAIARGALEYDWTDFITAMLHQEFQSNAVESHLKYTIDNERIIDATQQAPIHPGGTGANNYFVKILRVKLKISPQRTISDSSIGDPERAHLGSNGFFELYKCTRTLKTIIRYVNEEGTTKFEGVVPPPEDCHKAIQGNAGRDVCIMWETLNMVFASGGTTIKGALNPSDAVAHRRFFFWFKTLDELKVVLYHMFGQNMELVEEFFTDTGRFFAAERTQPDHAFVKLDAMDVDDVPVRVAYFGDDVTASYAYDPRGESQAL